MAHFLALPALVASAALVSAGGAEGRTGTPARTRARQAEALLQAGAGATPEALAAAADGVRLARADPKAAFLPSALRVLGRVQEDRGAMAEARAAFEEALALRRAARGRGTAGVLESLQDLAELELRAGNIQRAVDLQVAAAPAVFTSARVRTLEFLAAAARDLGLYSQAERAAQHLIGARRAAGEPIGLVGALNLLGDVAWFTKQYGQSRSFYAEAVEVARRALGGHHPLLGVSLANLGLVEFELGNVDQAERLQLEALDVTRRSRGETHPETADRLQNLANYRLDKGDYAQAMSLYERVQALTEQRFGADSDQAAHVFHNIGLLQARMGRPEAARRSYERALANWERTRGIDHPYVALELEILAGALLQTGAYAEADAHLARAAAIRERLPGAAMERAYVLARRGLIQLRLGRVAAARELAAAAAELCVNAGTAHGTDGATALAMLAELELELGQATPATRRLAAAVSTYADTFGPDHPRGAALRARWAEALLRTGATREAVAQALAAEEVRRRHVSGTARYLSETQALSLAARADARDVLLTAAASGALDHADVSRIFEELVRSRALVLDEMASRRPVAAAHARPLEADLAAARARLARLTYRQSRRPTVQRRSDLAAARRDLEDAERRWALATAAERGGAAPAGEADQAALRAALPARTALVSFFRFDDATRRGTFRYLAFVTRRDGYPLLVSLASAAEIDAAVAAWRRATRAPANAVEARLSEADTVAAGSALRRVVWDPLASVLAGAEHVLIVPDGQLALVSFAGLPGPDGRYLVEHDPTLHYLSTERDLLMPAPGKRPDSMLAIGGPDYDASRAVAHAAPARTTLTAMRSAGDDARSCAAAGGLHFAFLPHAAVEAREVAALWAEAGRRSQALFGPHASEPAVKRAATGHAVLHLATHGFFADGCGDQAASDPLSEPWRDNPLLHSGLALAAANDHESAPETDDDGLLTAAEVGALDLRGTDWVVLSACGTGLGRVQDGEGVLGLRRAFAVAGARTTIMSLWPVSDVHTRSWMLALYEARLAGRSTAEAVRDAQRHSLAQLRLELGAAPPALWAPFVAVGDWR